jgi:hypothetical protein
MTGDSYKKVSPHLDLGLFVFPPNPKETRHLDLESLRKLENYALRALFFLIHLSFSNSATFAKTPSALLSSPRGK